MADCKGKLKGDSHLACFSLLLMKRRWDLHRLHRPGPAPVPAQRDWRSANVEAAAPLELSYLFLRASSGYFPRLALPVWA